MANDIRRNPADEAAARQAIEIDPTNANAYFNLGFLLARDLARVDEAETAFRQAIELEPDNPRYIYRLALLLHDKLQRLDEADSLYRRAIELAPDDPFYYSGHISLLMQQSQQAEALALSKTMRTLLDASENWYGMAVLDAILGNVEASLNYLRQAARETTFDRQWARVDPDLASIRDDPRFDEIVGDL